MIAIFTSQVGPDCIRINLRRPKSQNFPGGGGGGGGCPQTPLNGALSRAIQSPPQTFSMLRFAPPCDISKRNPDYHEINH